MKKLCKKHNPIYFPHVDGVVCLKCGLIMKKEDLNIKTSDTVKVTENLFNFKRWFNGIKKFSSIKTQPPLTK